MLNYKDFKEEFLLEKLVKESVVYFSPEFSKILRKKRIKENEITKSLLEIEMTDIKPDVTFIDISDQEGYINFNTMRNALNKIKDQHGHLDFIKDEPEHSKEERRRLINDIYNHSKLSEIFTKSNPIRIGKFINKIFPGKFSETEREKFVNLFKSSLMKSSERFEIVEGDDIAFWYKEENYSEINGQLGTSCMRGMKEDTFDIYTKNKDVCRMLILLGEDDLLLGRSLIWNCQIRVPKNSYEDITFMDRQYTTKQSDVDKFRTYADKNGWAYKTVNSHSSLDSVTYKGEELSAKLKVSIDHIPTRFPYMDTFRRLSHDSDTLFNDKDKNTPGDYILDSTSGGYTEVEESGVWSEWHQRMIDEDDAVWSDWADSYLDRYSAVNVDYGRRRNWGWYPEGCDDLVYDEWSDITIHIDDSVYSEAYGYNIYDGHAVEVIQDIDSDGEPKLTNWYHSDDDNITNFYECRGMSWYKRLSKKWRGFNDYDYALSSLFTKNWNDELILNEFVTYTYRIIERKKDSILDPEELNTDYLTEIDALLLGYSIDKNDSRVVDKFEYYKEIEEILPKLYSKAKSEYNKTKDEISGIGQQKIVFDADDELQYKNSLIFRKNQIKEKISDLEDDLYSDIVSL
jgi:hypothetical protein